MEERINLNLEIKPEDFPKEYLNAKYIHFATNYPYKQKELIEYVRKNSNAKISIDTIEQYSKNPLLPEIYNMVDIAFIDDDFTELLNTTAGIQIIKKGKKSCQLKTSTKQINVLATPIDNVIDKTGAGDCLNGVFLAHMSKGTDIVDALKRAVDIATYSVNFYGLENIKNYLNKDRTENMI